jgi:hypothetical protein
MVVTSAKGGEPLLNQVNEVTGRAPRQKTVGLTAQSLHEHAGRVASKAVDGDLRSEWVSVLPADWNKELYVDIELDSVEELRGLSYLPRQSRSDN